MGHARRRRGWALLAAVAAACAEPPEAGLAPAPPPSAAPFPSALNRTYLTLGINSGAVDAAGRPARVPCLTCHAHFKASDQNARAAKLTRFHTGIELEHGNLVCLTCHRAEGRDKLGLADGRALEVVELKALCGQCHARRLEEYERGAHGGMSGYWDQTRGPRTRNLCTDCHDPHAPKIPLVVPATQPRIRH